MPRQQGQANVKSRIQFDEPQLYDVIMLNDDFTTMDFVVDVLVNTFFHPLAEAEAIMLRIHHEGQAVVGTYVYDLAMSKAAQTHEKARAQGFPLRLKVEPHR